MTCDQKMMNRLKRVIGQLNGVQTMMEEQRSCEEIVMQLSASKANLERMIAVITTQNLINKLQTQDEVNLKELEDEINLIIKSR